MDNLAYMERLVELFGYETGELTQDFLQQVADVVDEIQDASFKKGYEWGVLGGNIEKAILSMDSH